MKLLRTIIAATCLFLSMAALADNYTYLTIEQTGGETSFSVSSIQKITFDSTDMLITMTDGTIQRMPLSELSKMFFADDPAGMTTVETLETKFDIYDGVLRVTVNPGERFTLYNLKGEALFSSNTDSTVDLKTLKKGVYIAKVGHEALKVMAR